jgi:hypothetical protein
MRAVRREVEGAIVSARSLVQCLEVFVAVQCDALQHLGWHVGSAQFARDSVTAIHPDAGAIARQLTDVDRGIVALPRRAAAGAPHRGGIEAAGVAHGDADQAGPDAVGEVQEARQRGGVAELVGVIGGRISAALPDIDRPTTALPLAEMPLSADRHAGSSEVRKVSQRQL